MIIAINIAKLATMVDSRWEVQTRLSLSLFMNSIHEKCFVINQIAWKLLEGWKKTMDDELDFQTEAKNIAEVATKTQIVC